MYWYPVGMRPKDITFHVEPPGSLTVLNEAGLLVNRSERDYRYIDLV